MKRVAARPDDDPRPGKTIDLATLGMLTGKERSEREWAALLADNGFVLDRAAPRRDTPASPKADAEP